MRRPSTALTLVPEGPRPVTKQMPSPGANSTSPSRRKLRASHETTRPTYSPTDFGVSNDATPALRPAKKYSEAPRVKLLAGSGRKSGRLTPTDERRSCGRAASASSTARR